MKALTSFTLATVLVTGLVIGQRLSRPDWQSQQRLTDTPSTLARQQGSERNSMYRGSGRRVIMATIPANLGQTLA